jgi:hypothetical protein
MRQHSRDFRLGSFLGCLVEFVEPPALLAKGPESAPFFLYQNPRGVKFHDFAVCQDHKAIVIDYGVPVGMPKISVSKLLQEDTSRDSQSMGYRDDASVREFSPDGLLYDDICGHIDAGGGLVRDDQIGPPKHRACHRQELALAL